MFKKDRESFAAQWDDLRIFIEYGMLTDEKFMERAKKFMLFKDTTGACMTYEELIEAIGETQKDKNHRRPSSSWRPRSSSSLSPSSTDR